jgi:hypothetical protein
MRLGAMPLSRMEKWFVAHNNNNDMLMVKVSLPFLCIFVKFKKATQGPCFDP